MLLILLSAAFPAVVFLIVIYKKDTVKEPPKLLFECFFFGCITIIPVIFVEIFVGGFNTLGSPFWRSFYDAFVVAALVEEGFKFVCLYMIVWQRREFDQYFDGIVYAVFVSLGFALIENIMYVAEGGLGVALMRGVLAVPGHGLFGVAMGYFLSLSKFSLRNSKGYLCLSFFVPFLLHGLYDFFIMYLGESESGGLIALLFLGFAIVMILMWRFGLSYIKKHYMSDKSRPPSLRSW